MRSDLSRLALALYVLLAGLALVLGFVRGDPDVYHHPDPVLSLPFWGEALAGVLLGAGVGQGVVWLTQRSVLIWRWGPSVRLHRGLRQILGAADAPLRERDVLVLALSSAVAEEMLFRGWLLPAVGLAASSVLFGLVHYAPKRRDMLAWIPMAVVMGILLGSLFLLLGGLAAPMTAHFFINYRNLHFINSYDPSLRGGADEGPGS